MKNKIQKSECLSCGNSCFPQIVVKANEQDILALASSWHEMIEKYPVYSSAIGLTTAASADNVDHIIETIGADIALYNQPVMIGCFACTTDNEVIIDPGCAHPVSFADPVFVIERLLQSDPNAHVELLLIAIPDSDYPEQLIGIMDKILEILSFDMDPGEYELIDYDCIFETADADTLSIMIRKTFGISMSPNEIRSKAKIRDLVNAVYLKSVLHR